MSYLCSQIHRDKKQSNSRWGLEEEESGGFVSSGYRILVWEDGQSSEDAWW